MAKLPFDAIARDATARATALRLRDHANSLIADQAAEWVRRLDAAHVDQRREVVEQIHRWQRDDVASLQRVLSWTRKTVPWPLTKISDKDLAHTPHVTDATMANILGRELARRTRAKQHLEPREALRVELDYDGTSYRASVLNGDLLLAEAPYDPQSPQDLIKRVRPEHRSDLWDLIPNLTHRAQVLANQLDRNPDVPWLIGPETDYEEPDALDWRGVPLPTGDPAEYTLLLGDRKAGKSLFAGALCADMRRQGLRVLAVATEGYSTWVNRTRYYDGWEQPDILRSGSTEALTSVEGQTWDAVVVDSVRPALHAFEGTENDAAAVDWLIYRYAPLVRQVLVFVHHLGKDSAKGARGARAWEDQAGIVLQVSDIGGAKSQLRPILARSHAVEGLPTMELSRDPLGDRQPPTISLHRTGRPSTDSTKILDAIRDRGKPATTRYIRAATGMHRYKPLLQALLDAGTLHQHPGERGAPLWCAGGKGCPSGTMQLPTEAPGV